MRGRGYPMVAAFDLLACLLLIFVVLALTQKRATPPKIETLGIVAVRISWADYSNDDVDLYVRDPVGNIAYFSNQDAGLMHLEYDDLGTAVSGTMTLPDGSVVRIKEHVERVLVRGIVPGEYTANVHMYLKSDPGPQTVTVELWRLRGNDVIVYKRSIVLRREGQEETAFRFTLNAAGRPSDYNELPRRFVDAATPDYGAGYSSYSGGGRGAGVPSVGPPG